MAEDPLTLQILRVAKKKNIYLCIIHIYISSSLYYSFYLSPLLTVISTGLNVPIHTCVKSIYSFHKQTKMSFFLNEGQEVKTNLAHGFVQ
jgi:hypothetical protein